MLEALLKDQKNLELFIVKAFMEVAGEQTTGE